jgi:hypothetical protein
VNELEDKMLKLRKSLPQAYELTGTEAGTGKITVPKGMTTKQALDYDEAVRRRMDPEKAARSDERMARIKAQAQEAHREKLGKPRPTYFPPPEDEDKAAFRQFFEEADKQDPVSGDYEPTEQDLEDEFEEFTDPGAKTLQELADEERANENRRAFDPETESLLRTVGPAGEPYTAAVDHSTDLMLDYMDPERALLVEDVANAIDRIAPDDEYIGTDEEGNHMYRMGALKTGAVDANVFKPSRRFHKIRHEELAEDPSDEDRERRDEELRNMKLEDSILGDFAKPIGKG